MSESMQESAKLTARRGRSTKDPDGPQREAGDSQEAVERPNKKTKPGSRTKVPVHPRHAATSKRRLLDMLERIPPWLSAIAAIIAVVLAAISLGVGQCQYNEVTKPHSQSEEIRDRIYMLKDALTQIEAALASPTSIAGVNRDDLQDAFDRATALALEASIAFSSDRRSAASEAIKEANGCIASALPREASHEVSTANMYVVATGSFDGWVSIDAPSGTTAQTKDGESLSAVTVSIPLSGHTSNVVLTLDITPHGAVFSVPVFMTFHYLPAKIPSGFREENLVVATWDESTGQWDRIPGGTINLQEHCITVSVDRVGQFGVLASV